MLNLDAMTSGDAQHTLQVYGWITDNLDIIKSRAATPQHTEVSANDVQATFYGEFTLLSSMRFLPVRIDIFTDEDALDAGEQREPNVSLYRPDESDVAIVDHLNTQNLSKVTALFGIDGDEQAWTISH